MESLYVVLGENGIVLIDEGILKRFEEYYCKLLDRKTAEYTQEKIVLKMFNSINGVS